MFERYVKDTVLRMNIPTLLRNIEEHEQALRHGRQVEIVKDNLALLYEEYTECMHIGLIKPAEQPVSSTPTRATLLRQLHLLRLQKITYGISTPLNVLIEIEGIEKALLALSASGQNW